MAVLSFVLFIGGAAAAPFPLWWNVARAAWHSCASRIVADASRGPPVAERFKRCRRGAGKSRGPPSPRRVLASQVNEAAEPPVDVTQYGFRPRSSTQVGNSCAADPPPHSNAGCQHWTQGLFPTIDDDGTWNYGGVPQNADLDAHIRNINETLTLWLPDPAWTGNAVLDFEAWSPAQRPRATPFVSTPRSSCASRRRRDRRACRDDAAAATRLVRRACHLRQVWDENNSPENWHAKRYQNASKQLVAEAHPDWNASYVASQAKKEFEAAATNWFVATLKACKALRPAAVWGFYGLPNQCYGDCVGEGDAMKCGYDGPNATLERSWAEVNQLPIWEASDALFPSIYISPLDGPDQDVVRAKIRSTVGEAVRCGSLTSTPKPVYPYGWDHFHDPPDGMLVPLSHVAERRLPSRCRWSCHSRPPRARCHSRTPRARCHSRPPRSRCHRQHAKSSVDAGT